MRLFLTQVFFFPRQPQGVRQPPHVVFASRNDERNHRRALTSHIRRHIFGAAGARRRPLTPCEGADDELRRQGGGTRRFTGQDVRQQMRRASATVCWNTYK